MAIDNSVKNNAIVILGASGDLTKRKLIPALAKLLERNVIDKTSVVIGSGRSAFDDSSFRQKLPDLSDDFKSILFYHRETEGIKKFIDKKGGFDRIIFFFALPPMIYASAARQLHEEGFGKESTIVIEKPFGYDYKTAHELNNELSKYFDDSQIYITDHYLAKEAVQNILVFRFANYLFSPVWNNQCIDSIQVNAFEDMGVEDRGSYFDSAGIIRDMVQNHLIQLLCLLTMEAPVDLSAEEIRNKKVDILKDLRVANCCKHQYRGYLQEKGVKKNSKTETYAELKLFVDNLRWSGVPIYIRTGKALNRKGTEIGVKFKSLPKILYNKNGDIEENKIIFKIQPAEGIVVDLASKIPGSGIKITNTNMSFCYRDSFDSEMQQPYERLFADVLKGDKTLFVSAEEAELSWKVFEPVLKTTELQYYEKGTAPKSCYCGQWINFEKYLSVCSS